MDETPRQRIDFVIGLLDATRTGSVAWTPKHSDDESPLEANLGGGYVVELAWEPSSSRPGVRGVEYVVRLHYQGGEVVLSIGRYDLDEAVLDGCDWKPRAPGSGDQRWVLLCELWESAVSDASEARGHLKAAAAKLDGPQAAD